MLGISRSRSSSWDTANTIIIPPLLFKVELLRVGDERCCGFMVLDKKYTTTFRFLHIRIS